MRRTLLPALPLLALLTTAPGRAPGDTPAADPKLADRTAAIRSKLDAQLPNLEALYKDLHTHPELSLMEARTADHLAKELQALGFEVTTRVGGTGVVGLLKNGPGRPSWSAPTWTPCRSPSGPACPTPVRCAPATARATRSGRCTPAATTCT